jgi:hypothetical protein
MDNGDLFGFVGVDFSNNLSATTADSTVKDVEVVKRSAESIGS